MNRTVFEQGSRRSIVEYIDNGLSKFWETSHCVLTLGGWWKVKAIKTYAKESTAIRSAEKFISN